MKQAWQYLRKALRQASRKMSSNRLPSNNCVSIDSEMTIKNKIV